MFLNRVSLVIAIAVLLTVGSVYAEWFYADKTDVADWTSNRLIEITSAEYIANYGRFVVDSTGLETYIDPKEGTNHITALYADGSIVVTFIPSDGAPSDVLENGVLATWAFSLSDEPAWVYDNGNGDQSIGTVDSASNSISWTKESDGTFTFEITDQDVLNHIILTEFDLSTMAKYTEYSRALGKSALILTVTDGTTSSGATTP